jgi:phage minor structural protein
MYKIYADDTLIYDSTLEDYIITKGVVSKEVNKSGSFTFTIYQDNPFFNRIQKLKTIIRVYKRDKILFRGRVIKEELGFYNDKTFICEGELSFLLDSIQRPYGFTGSPADLFAQFINVHNSQVDDTKKFIIGNVSILDNNNYINRSNSNYEDTFTNVEEHLIKTHGGYLDITRDANNMPILNWIQDYSYESNQLIEFGENLLDFTKTNSVEEIATAIIPIGSKIGEGNNEAETRLTIENVNNGLDYIYDETAVATYGYIFKVVTWDDVTTPENLLTKARAYLNESINQNITIELTAVDLSLLDSSIDDFELGDYIRIVSRPHGVDDKLLLKKQSIDLLKPENDEITLGYTYSTFTDRTLSNANQNTTLVKTVETINNNYAVNTVINTELESLRSLIDQTSTSISTEILRDYVVNDELVQSISTLYTQLSDLFEFKFTTLESTVNENDINSRREFREIQKYIRFEDGDIILGESGNELTLRIENDRISFIEGGAEVAYFSNQKLYVTDTEILQSLKLGNFAFTPRENGNLTFKKVGG